MSLPQPLMFTVGMIDQITKPIAKVSNSLNGLTNDYQRGTMKMASGVAGIAASGYALQNALMPAIEMDRALGEVKSLGVRESALKQLTDTSYEFALKYGKSSTEFVKSSYDIQSAIAGLNDNDLSAFTMSSNVLAAATKADAATVTEYMGTMYGIFENQANTMGKGKWVEQLTGMTATAVQAFKTDGKKMADAFGALGSGSTAPMAEQMAILGTLQATMSGSESATKYSSIMAGVGKAQEALNLVLTDAQGNMLPMVDVLDQIKGKFGETISDIEGGELAKAFGSKNASSAIRLLIKNVDGLSGSVEKLNQVEGQEQAEKMAMAMADQSERLSASWYVIRAALGSAILPAFNDFVGLIADMGSGVLSFTEEFPTLTKWLGYAAVGVLAFVAAGGLISVVMGGATMAMTAWNTATMIGRGISAAFTASLAFLRGAMLAVNLVMYANPIGLIVAGITLAIAAVGALVYYWDDLKATMSEWGWVKAIAGIFNTVWGGIKSVFNDTMDWIIDKLNMIPGVDIDTSLGSKSGSDLASKMALELASLSSEEKSSIAAIAPVKSRVERGGITQQISNANQHKSTSVGTVNVYPAKGETNYMNFVEMHS